MDSDDSDVFDYGWAAIADENIDQLAIDFVRGGFKGNEDAVRVEIERQKALFRTTLESPFTTAAFDEKKLIAFGTFIDIDRRFGDRNILMLSKYVVDPNYRQNGVVTKINGFVCNDILQLFGTDSIIYGLTQRDFAKKAFKDRGVPMFNLKDHFSVVDGDDSFLDDWILFIFDGDVFEQIKPLILDALEKVLGKKFVVKR
ncbi:MAG: hypothetical protein US89_C0016G0045 [Candidatus Peregrinibacteria bacterium GW2011_GWF2_38_29]|nr:MAG: hypothetical protein US89_C0016G0045 [Candidatus Peregrinibacteria bacterium GW2011_GWF2_38_29]HBB03156.1 hypothetical protein [Candidatus Peregrinibacteria bacterium]